MRKHKRQEESKPLSFQVVNNPDRVERPDGIIPAAVDKLKRLKEKKSEESVVV